MPCRLLPFSHLSVGKARLSRRVAPGFSPGLCDLGQVLFPTSASVFSPTERMIEEPLTLPGKGRCARFCPRTFAFTVPCTWRLLSQVSIWLALCCHFGVCLEMSRSAPLPPSEDLLQVRDFLYRTILCSLSHFSALNTELGMAGGHLSWNQALEGRNLVNSPGSPEARVRRHCCREPPTSPTTQDVLCSSLPWVKGGLLQCSALCPLPDQV